MAARKEQAQAKSPRWWHDLELRTSKFEKDEFVPRGMYHLANQYKGVIGSTRRIDSCEVSGFDTRQATEDAP